ncbi:MAG: VOC family protein [Caldilineaceae bacterium]|nr:VOC family protein [Caldilineaceae bacterium]
MSFRLHPGAQIGVVALVVADLRRSLDYYTQRIGLEALGQEGDTASLGVGGRELLWLQEQPGAKPAPRRNSGLYHFALLTPSRPALGETLRHLVETRTPLDGASDHGVSEALYLSDPDGHGIEIYHDRPRAEWPIVQGKLGMTLDPLDAEGILAAAENDAWHGLAAGTFVGHIHLHVAQLAAAEAFYTGALGMDLMQRFAGQASFLSAGGYHHHVGVNVWAGVGAPPPPEDAARLLWVELRLPDEASPAALLANLEAQGIATEAHARGVLVRDPAQNAIVLRS